MRASSVKPHPGVVFVADARKYEQVRGLVHSIREQQRWGGELYCLDIGLTDAQRQTLRMARIRLVKVIQGSADAIPMRQPFLWKLFAHRYAPQADPLLVCDVDLEFRAPGVLAELMDRARRSILIAEEFYGWCSNVNVKYELQGVANERLAFLEPIWESLRDGPILNAGLFGGPRPQIASFLDLAGIVAAAGLDVFHWFWEQIAFNVLVRMQLYNVAVLPTTDNWITSWGDNPEARIFHFSGEALANQLRTPVPADYLLAIENAPKWAPRGGVEVLGR